MSNVPDLLKGSIKLYIKYRLGRNYTQEEVDRLAEEWNRNPRMSLKEFMRDKK